MRGAFVPAAWGEGCRRLWEVKILKEEKLNGKNRLLIGDLADDADYHKKTGQSSQQNVQTHASAPPFLQFS